MITAFTINGFYETNYLLICAQIFVKSIKGIFVYWMISVGYLLFNFYITNPNLTLISFFCYSFILRTSVFTHSIVLFKYTSIWPVVSTANTTSTILTPDKLGLYFCGSFFFFIAYIIFFIIFFTVSIFGTCKPLSRLVLIDIYDYISSFYFLLFKFIKSVVFILLTSLVHFSSIFIS